MQYAFTELIESLDLFKYDFFSSVGYKGNQTEKKEKKVESVGFNYFSLCQELVKVFRSAIMYDGNEIPRDYSMQDLSDIA